ncbi:hypothetical protein OP853_004661 [Salmonella enterica]|nr:hypothetical protein [Salmonella enterica]
MNSPTKKLILAMAACSVFAGINTASAAVSKNPVSITIKGDIKDNTCDLKAVTLAGEEITAAGLSVGEANISDAAPKAVGFKLVPSIIGSCATSLGGNVDIKWEGSLGEDGYTNTAADGTNAVLHLNPVSGGVNQAALVNAWTENTIKTGIDTVHYNRPSAQDEYYYEAGLVAPVGGFTPGAFSTTASFAVTYN